MVAYNPGMYGLGTVIALFPMKVAIQIAKHYGIEKPKYVSEKDVLKSLPKHKHFKLWEPTYTKIYD